MRTQARDENEEHCKKYEEKKEHGKRREETKAGDLSLSFYLSLLFVSPSRPFRQRPKVGAPQIASKDQRE